MRIGRHNRLGLTHDASERDPHQSGRDGAFLDEADETADGDDGSVGVCDIVHLELCVD